MSAQASVVRPLRPLGVLLSLIPLGVAIALPWLLGMPVPLILGSSAFLLYRVFVVRLWLCKDHRQGLRLLRRGRFQEGAEAFERSERVWATRPILDRHRHVLLGSATPYSWVILGRYNRAYAFSRLGRGQEALELLQSVLADDPRMLQARELRDVLLAGSALDREVGEAMGGSPS